MDPLIAAWFHARLTPSFAHFLYALSEPGSGLGIGIVLGLAVLSLLWRRHWRGLGVLLLTVPGGMLLGEAVKLLVRRPRPYTVGPFVDWDGYSFPSGHTIGATLLYGLLTLFLLTVLKTRRSRLLVIASAALIVSLVGFSRIALGAHYLSDVVGAIVIGSFWLASCWTGVQMIRRIGSRSADASRAEQVPQIAGE